MEGLSDFSSSLALNDLVDCFTWGLHETWFSFESHCLVSSDFDSGLYLPNNVSVCCPYHSLPLSLLATEYSSVLNHLGSQSLPLLFVSKDSLMRLPMVSLKESSIDGSHSSSIGFVFPPVALPIVSHHLTMQVHPNSLHRIPPLTPQFCSLRVIYGNALLLMIFQRAIVARCPTALITPPWPQRISR